MTPAIEGQAWLWVIGLKTWGTAWLLAAAIGAAALAADRGDVDWAYPGAGPPAPAAKVVAQPHALPGSKRRFSDARLADLFRAVDWWPERHSPAPAPVSQGRQPHVMACGYCHLPSGEGRPENAALAGLPADYIVQQMADMKSGARKSAVRGWGPSVRMMEIAAAATPSEVAAAAAYFSKARFISRVHVVESATITGLEADKFVYRKSGRALMDLGERIVEGPDDFSRFELRDNTVSYTAYVPPGAIARGRRLAKTTAQPCASCHGPHFEGGQGPPLAGRSPTYLFRQLHAFKTGVRTGPEVQPMQAVTAGLTTRDMIDLAAFMAVQGQRGAHRP